MGRAPVTSIMIASTSNQPFHPAMEDAFEALLSFMNRVGGVSLDDIDDVRSIILDLYEVFFRHRIKLLDPKGQLSISDEEIYQNCRDVDMNLEVWLNLDYQTYKETKWNYIKENVMYASKAVSGQFCVEIDNER